MAKPKAKGARVVDNTVVLTIRCANLENRIRELEDIACAFYAWTEHQSLAAEMVPWMSKARAIWAQRRGRE